MKAKQFLLAALVITNAFAFAQQNEHEGMDGDSIERIREMMARVDSMAPAPGLETDSAVAVTDSIADSTQTAVSTTDSASTATVATDAGHGDTEEKISVNQRYGMWGYLIPILIILFAGLHAMRKKGWLTFKRRSKTEKLTERLRNTTLRQQILTLISNANVDRKKYALEKLIGAFMTECNIKLKEGMSVDEVNKLMDHILKKLLEGKRYLRWNPWPFVIVSSAILGFILVAGLVTWGIIAAWKQDVHLEVTYKEKPTAPVDTFKVVEMEAPEELIEEVEYQEPPTRRRPLVENATADSTWWWVEAPADNFGEITVPQKGYITDYYPEAPVLGMYDLDNPNSTSPPFPMDPGDKLKMKWKPVAWSSRSNQGTRVMVVQKVDPNRRVFSSL